MALKIFYESFQEEFAEAIREIEEPIAKTATGAMREAGDILKRAARADIRRAGFSRRWQNTLKVVVHPKSRVSMRPAASLFHKIDYSDVFETGAAIRGRPMLWLPLPSAPLKPGQQGKPRQLTPRDLSVRTGARLVPMKSKAGRPLLGVKVRSNAPGGRLTLTEIRRGSAGTRAQGTVRTVPVFSGHSTITIPDKFNIREITVRTGDKLPSLYLKHFVDE